MKRFHYALITAAFAALLLSACGSADTDTAGSSGDNSLVVLNYGKYLDASAIKMFEQETGIKIKLEEYESPEEMYTKFSAGSISYDVVCTSDYMVERLIHEGKVAPIDFSSSFTFVRTIIKCTISSFLCVLWLIIRTIHFVRNVFLAKM